MITQTEPLEGTTATEQQRQQSNWKGRIKPFNERLRADFEIYRDAHQATNAQLVKELGDFDVTAVSKYLNGKFEGDVRRLESLIGDVLKSALLRVEIQKEIFECEVAREMESVFETVRKTEDVAVISGPAGIGKSCGIQYYRTKHPTAVALWPSKMSCNAEEQLRLLWGEVDTSGWAPSKGQTKFEYLVEKFKGSNRLIIIDNGQRLTVGAFAFWMDFHDLTGTRICPVGNPSILDRIKKMPDWDQATSRVGQHCQLELRDPTPFARKILAQFLTGDQAAKVEKMAIEVVKHQGHGRALRKHVWLAKELMLGTEIDIVKAFKMAHTRLIGPEYVLAE